MENDFANAPEVREASQLVASMTALATGYSVTTAVQYSDGGEQLKKVKGAQNRLEALRLSITKPLNIALKAANDLFREPAQRLVDAEKAIKIELSRYAEEQERIRREEQRRADERAEAERRRLQAIADEAQRKADEEAAAKRREADEAARAGRAADAARLQAQAQKVEQKAAAKAETFSERAAAVQAPIIQREPPKIVGVSMRKVPQWEITDASLLPREYLVPDEKKIGGVVRALKLDANIPGVRVRMVDQVASGAA